MKKQKIERVIPCGINVKETVQNLPSRFRKGKEIPTVTEEAALNKIEEILEKPVPEVTAKKVATKRTTKKKKEGA